MNKIILTDSGFWLGLADSTDQYHQASNSIADLIEDNIVLLPWPCLYEIVSTRLVRSRKRLLIFEEIIRKENVMLIEDNEYKSDALKQVFLYNRIHGYTYSFVDGVIREILKDVSRRIDFLVTFNVSDFKDVCDQRLIEIISE